jgi:modulator of FtsH protease
MGAAYSPESWQNFYVMTGGAAAALTGLLFVAMSAHARAILRHPVFSSRAVGTLVSLLCQLLISGAVLVPGQPLNEIGIEVELAAVFFLVVSIRAIVRSRSHGRPAGASAGRAVVEMVGALIWLVLFIASGLSLIARTAGGFYLLALVMGFMFGWNIYVAWTLITEVAD